MADKKEIVSGKYLEYKGQPLVREGDTICYGDKSEKCILVLEIMSYEKQGERELPANIKIQIIDSNDPNNILRQGSKKGLYEAFSLGIIWLEHELKKDA